MEHWQPYYAKSLKIKLEDMDMEILILKWDIELNRKLSKELEMTRKYFLKDTI